MKKILIITATLNYGGVERPLVDGAKILADSKKYRPIVLNLSGLGELKDELQNTNIEYITLDQKILRKNVLKTIIKIRKLIKNIKPDIIHTHQFASNFYGSMSTIGLSIPIIFHMYNPQMELPSRRIIRWFLSKTLIDDFIVETEVQKNLIARTGIRKNKIFVVNNAFNPKNITVSENFNKDAFKKHISVPRNSFVIGAVGRLAHEKGYDTLIKAVGELIKNGLDLFLVIVGDGPEKDNLEKLAQEVGIKKKIIFIGFMKNVANIMSLFDIFVVSSYTESFSVVATEAMFLKIPVIITDRLMSRDLFAEAVITVSPTASSLREGIEYLYHNKTKRMELVEKGIKLVEEKFTIDMQVEKLKIIYDNILGKKS